MTLEITKIIQYILNTLKNSKMSILINEETNGISLVSECYNEYYTRIKGLLNLTKMDLTHIDLPKVIVIGSESSGKSSLMENITKCQLFPKDSDFCTKLPIRVIMKTVYDIKDVKYNIKYNNKDIITNLNSIYSEIKNIMDNLDDIYNDELIVEIYDMNVINFEFYDLPGIRAYPPDMKEKTSNLVKKYIQMENVIPICVIPSTTTRLTSYMPLALILELKKEENTILCLTMCDRLSNDNIEELLINRLLKQTNELNYDKFVGICGIINRTHKNLVMLKDIDYLEKVWFKNNVLSINSNIENKLGIKNLVKLLTVYYKEYISTNWILNLKFKINEEINKQKDKLNNLLAIINKNSIYYEFIKNYIIEDIMYRYYGVYQPSKEFRSKNEHFYSKYLINDILNDIKLCYDKFDFDKFKYNYSDPNSLIMNSKLYESVFNINLDIKPKDVQPYYEINEKYNKNEILDNYHFVLRDVIYNSNNGVNTYFKYCGIDINELTNYNNLILEISNEMKLEINRFIQEIVNKYQNELEYDFSKRYDIGDFRFIFNLINNQMKNIRILVINNIKNNFDSIKNKYNSSIILEQQKINNTIMELSHKLTELNNFN